MTWASEKQQLEATSQASNTRAHTLLSAGVDVCYAGWSSVEVIRLSVCLQLASLSLSPSHSPEASRTPDFNSFIDVFCSTDPLSPSIYVSSSTVKTHSSQAYTHQEFFINSSHFLILFPLRRKCFSVQAKDRLMPPCPVWIHMMFCLVDFEKWLCSELFEKFADSIIRKRPKVIAYNHIYDSYMNKC